MALKDLKHIPMGHDDSDDIAARRVSYEHGDYEDVTDLGEYRLHEELSNLQTQKNEDGGNVYRVEVGVLVTNKSHEDYGHYAAVYDHQYGYYDENQYYEQDKKAAIDYVKDYVEKGVDFTYGIVAPTTLDSSCFENGKLRDDVDVEGEDYSAEEVIFSIAKIHEKIIKGFIVIPKESEDTMKADELRTALIEDLTSKKPIVPVIKSNPGCGTITFLTGLMLENQIELTYVDTQRIIDRVWVDDDANLGDELLKNASDNPEKTYVILFDEFTRCAPEIHLQIMNIVCNRKVPLHRGLPDSSVPLPDNIRFVLTETSSSEFRGCAPLKLYGKITQPL